MKPLILSAVMTLTVGLIGTAPALAQSQRLTCVRERNIITCPNHGSFQYSYNLNDNRKPINITCIRDDNMITCPNHGSFRYSSNNNSNNNWSNNNSNQYQEINDLYIQVLGRNAERNELRNYNQALNNQACSLTEARRNLVNSQEFNQAVNNIYREYLGRNADNKGWQSYRNAVMNGRNLEQIRNEIANSPEASKRNNNNYNNDGYYSNDGYYNNDDRFYDDDYYNNDDGYYNDSQLNNKSGTGNPLQNVLCELTGLCF